MAQITTEIAASRIETFAREGRLIQNAWHQQDEGKELACLLGAIDPAIKSTSDCPADIMPQWGATVLVRLFDGVREEKALDYGLRFAAALRKTQSWSNARWKEALNQFLVATVENAVASATLKGDPPAYWTQVKEACESVVSFLRAGASPAKLNAAARAAADAAARAAAYAAAAYAAYAAEYAAYAAAEYAAYAAAYAAYAAEYAAYAAAEYAEYAAAKAAYEAAKAADAAEYAAAYAADAAEYAAAYAADAAAPDAAAAYEKLFDRLIEILEGN